MHRILIVACMNRLCWEGGGVRGGEEGGKEGGKERERTVEDSGCWGEEGCVAIDIGFHFSVLRNIIEINQ